MHATEICIFLAWEPRVSKNCVKSDEEKQVPIHCSAIYACDISNGVCTSAVKCLGSTDCNELNELSAFVSVRLGCSGPGVRSALCTEASLGQTTDPNVCSIMATSVSLASTCMALCWVPIHKPHTNISTCFEPNSSQYMKSFHHSF